VGITNDVYQEERSYQQAKIVLDGNPELDLDGNQVYETIVTPAVYADFVTLKEEYEITTKDLSIDAEWIEEQQLIEAEKAFTWGSSLFRKIKARVLLFNKVLAANGNPLTELQTIDLLTTSDMLEKALGSASFGTSVYILNQLKIALPQYSGIVDYAINEIINSGYPL
jgi:hypothetical protein